MTSTRIWVKSQEDAFLYTVFMFLLARLKDISYIALNHRDNKNLRQRIIVFVASTLDGPRAYEQLMVMGNVSKRLKKNNVEMQLVSSLEQG